MNITKIKVMKHLQKEYEENRNKRIKIKRQRRIDNIKKQCVQIGFLLF